MSFSVPAMPDSDLTLSAAKGKYTIDAVSAPAPRGHLVLNKSFGNFIVLGILSYLKWNVYVASSHESIYHLPTIYILVFSYKPYFILFF